MEFDKQLYELRKKAHLSQEQLAEKVGVARQTISKWELGETSPDLRQAQRLAQIFHVSLDELTGSAPQEVVREPTGNADRLAGMVIKALKILGILLLVSFFISAIGTILFTCVRQEPTDEQSLKMVTITEHVGEETYIIDIGTDGHFEAVGLTEKMEEEIKNLIVPDDLPSSVTRIEHYFRNLRENP